MLYLGGAAARCPLSGGLARLLAAIDSSFALVERVRAGASEIIFAQRLPRAEFYDWGGGRLVVLTEILSPLGRYDAIDGRILADAERIAWRTRNVGAWGVLAEIDRHNEDLEASRRRDYERERDAREADAVPRILRARRVCGPMYRSAGRVA